MKKKNLLIGLEEPKQLPHELVEEYLQYKELSGYFEGEYPLEEAVRIIKRDTRHFAKRQLTWFRRERDVIWLDKSEIGREDEQLIQQMLTVLKEKEIIH